MDNSMTTTITVRDVIETNDCAGRKYIDVTSMAEDEIVPARYNLTGRYMFPDEKLCLASVAPMDKVVVDFSRADEMGTFVGEYIGNHFNPLTRQAVCRCGNPMASDGFSIYCLNLECPLTLGARLDRLANLSFFRPETLYHRHHDDPVLNDLISHDSFAAMETPFKIILNPKFWGTNVTDFNHILLNKNRQHVSIATFYLEELLIKFIDCNPIRIDTTDIHFAALSNFYGMLDQTIYRREYTSGIQNYFLRSFILGLGIQSLNEKAVEQLMIIEEELCQTDAVLLHYLYYLSNSAAFHSDTGIPKIVTDAVAKEFYLRRYEFYDIFHYYALPEDVNHIFNNIDSRMAIKHDDY